MPKRTLCTIWCSICQNSNHATESHCQICNQLYCYKEIHCPNCKERVIFDENYNQLDCNCTRHLQMKPCEDCGGKLRKIKYCKDCGDNYYDIWPDDRNFYIGLDFVSTETPGCIRLCEEGYDVIVTCLTCLRRFPEITDEQINEPLPSKLESGEFAFKKMQHFPMIPIRCKKEEIDDLKKQDDIVVVNITDNTFTLKS